MNKLRSATTAVLLCFLLALTLSACSGSGSSTTASSTTGSNIQMSVAADNQLVTVSWTDPAYPTGSNETYNVYYSTAPFDATPLNDVTSKNPTVFLAASNTTSPFVHTGLTNGKTYYYFVTRASGSTASTPSLSAMAVPQAATPAAPDGLSISATSGTVTLAFDTKTASQPPSSPTPIYNIYYNTTGTTPISQNYTNKITNPANFNPSTTGVPFSITNLSTTSTPTYYFAVTVVVNGVESTESDTLTAIPMAAAAATNTTPSTPDGLTVEPGNQQAIISWSPSITPTASAGGTTVYTIQAAKNDPTFLTNTTTVSNITGTSYTLTGLTNRTPNTPIIYYFRVSASFQATGANTTTTSPYSTTISATPYTKVPDVPSGIAASQDSPQAVALSWSQDTSGIQSSISYNIYYLPLLSSATPPASSAALEATAKANNYIITDITTNSYVHSGLTPNTTYYYVITSVGEGESAPSAIVAVSL